MYLLVADGSHATAHDIGLMPIIAADMHIFCIARRVLKTDMLD